MKCTIYRLYHLVCRARDLVPMARGATCAAAVATWVLICARVDVLAGVAALRRRVARRFRMRTRLVNLVGMVVGLSVGVTSYAPSELMAAASAWNE